MMKPITDNFSDKTSSASLRFGDWTSTGRVRVVSEKTQFLCRCKCGIERWVNHASLKMGVSTSCGCRRRMLMKNALPDLAGKRFGRWTVVSHAGHDKHNKRLWKCACDCGHAELKSTGALTSGKSKSCGCFKTGKTKLSRPIPINHGMSHDPELSIWHSIKRRCFNPKCKNFPDYGGRGITACERLMSHPSEIVRCVGLKPHQERPRHFSLDRIDNNGHYSCGECKQCKRNGWAKNIRWATQDVQTRNTRANRMISINGITKCMSSWAVDHGVSIQTISSRLRRGYSGDDLISKLRLRR